ncbi:MAG: hypothetical protein KBT06_07405 [Prevotellaceae bacterium]|nr:hypothetical protein [Candidatus Colivivens equi]
MPFEVQAEMTVAEKATTGGENVQGDIHSTYDSQESFFSNTKYTKKVQNQIKSGDFHSFPSSVEAFESSGVVEIIQGGDGIIRSKLSIPGYYRGRKGVFEFIKEPNGYINHRLFNIK